MWFRFKHPKLHRSVRFMMSADGEFFARGRDVARLCNYKNSEYFCRKFGKLRVRDVVYLRGTAPSLSNEKIFSFRQIESNVHWKAVEALKTIFDADARVSVSRRGDSDARVEYVGGSRADDVVPMREFMADFKTETYRLYDELSEYDILVPGQKGIPSAVNVRFGDASPVKYVKVSG